MKSAYLGIDVGSITINLAVTDGEGRLLEKKYLRTHGQPVQVMQTGLRELARELGDVVSIQGVGTTGSGRISPGFSPWRAETTGRLA